MEWGVTLCQLWLIEILGINISIKVLPFYFTILLEKFIQFKEKF